MASMSQYLDEKMPSASCIEDLPESLDSTLYHSLSTDESFGVEILSDSSISCNSVDLSEINSGSKSIDGQSRHTESSPLIINFNENRNVPDSVETPENDLASSNSDQTEHFRVQCDDFHGKKIQSTEKNSMKVLSSVHEKCDLRRNKDKDNCNLLNSSLSEVALENYLALDELGSNTEDSFESSPHGTIEILNVDESVSKRPELFDFESSSNENLNHTKAGEPMIPFLSDESLLENQGDISSSLPHKMHTPPESLVSTECSDLYIPHYSHPEIVKDNNLKVESHNRVSTLNEIVKNSFSDATNLKSNSSSTYQDNSKSTNIFSLSVVDGRDLISSDSYSASVDPKYTEHVALASSPLSIIDHYSDVGHIQSTKDLDPIECPASRAFTNSCSLSDSESLENDFQKVVLDSVSDEDLEDSVSLSLNSSDSSLNKVNFAITADSNDLVVNDVHVEISSESLSSENDSSSSSSTLNPKGKSKVSPLDFEEGNEIELQFDLQNSPMLRRSRVNDIEGRTRRDCRYLFNEEVSASDSEETSESEDEKFRCIRDSIDIAKHCQYIITDDEEEQDPVGTGKEENKSDLADSLESLDQLSPFTQPIVVSFKKKTRAKGTSRRVSFPEDESRLITSYLEPVNPRYHMVDVCNDDISKAYLNSCNKYKVQPLPSILQQITALPVALGERIECLSVRNIKLDYGQCECLEEIFRRVQFRTLDLENCELEDETSIPLFDMIEFYDSAFTINISSNIRIGMRGWQACGKLLKKSPSLSALEARNTNLNEENMPIFCKSLRTGSHLHILHLENCNLSGRPLGILAGAIRYNDSITDLYLADNRLDSNDCIPIGNLIRSNRTLKILDLRNNNIQDVGCGYLCKEIADRHSNPSFKNNENTKCGLTMLVLWNNHLTPNSVHYLSIMLSSSQTLETLNLGRNAITNDGIMSMKNSLIKTKTLIRLGLQATMIGNEGAVALAECLADNKVLSRIDLRENRIQVAGLLALSTSLKLNDSIVQIDLDASPKLEPTTELSNQHMTLHNEIKTLCQSNLTKFNEVKTATEESDGEKLNVSEMRSRFVSPEKRKISLTCETIIRPIVEDLSKSPIPSENKRYWSPEPSPNISPCPSPSFSPSLSPTPSPLKNNRFRVFKVKEERSCSLSPSIGLHPISSSATLSTDTSSFLPNAMSTSLPNRFSRGGRFTVTKVSEPCSLLPSCRTMSSPSIIGSMSNNLEGAPTIVVSSPNKAVKGFSIEDDDDQKKETKETKTMERCSSLEDPTTASGSSDSDSSLQDDVFEPNKTLAKHTVIRSESLPEFKGDLNSDQSMASCQKAPLASTEIENFDSDSGEDSNDSSLKDQ